MYHYVMDTKLCTTCKRELPLSEFYRKKNGQSRGATCRTCEKARTTAWRRTEQGKASAQRTNEKYNASERGKAKRAEYNHTEKSRAMKEAWRQTENGQACLARYRQSDKRKAVLKKYYESGKGRAAIARYQDTPKGRESLSRGVHKRRGRLSTVEATLTAQEWEAIKARQNYRCLICGKETERLTRDHIIPLSKGGRHTADNIQALCRSCNSRKNNRL